MFESLHCVGENARKILQFGEKKPPTCRKSGVESGKEIYHRFYGKD